MAATPQVQAFTRDAVQDPTLLVGRVQLLRRDVGGVASDAGRRDAALDAIDGLLKHLALRLANLRDAETDAAPP